MRRTGLKPIECLPTRFKLNGTRLLPDIWKRRSFGNLVRLHFQRLRMRVE